MIDSHIIEKIRKLRALTERRGATEEEALAAQQRMFALLTRYNLELSQIPEGEPTKPDTTIESETTERPSNVWKQYLHTAVAKLNFTECFTLGGHIYVIGTKANRIATMEMASYLIATVERLANESAAEVPGDERRRYRHSFAEGCAARIYERLEALQAEAAAGRMKAADPNSLLPALADLYQTSKARVDDFITNHFGKLSYRTHRVNGGHGGGYIAGYSAGDQVGLHRQVGVKARRRLLSA
jgi:hypothetical protein